MKQLPLLFLFVLFSCIQGKKELTEKEDIASLESSNSYAQGFNIIDHGDYSILEISAPFQNSDVGFKYALVDRNKAAAMTFPKDVYDAIILTPIHSIVVTSTTHLPALELLGVPNTLTGFPGTDYVSSEVFRRRIHEGHVREIGKNEDLNTELLLELHPDVVVGFGINGVSKTLNRLDDARIPVIYNGDWVESHPLAKAEWIKVFGLLYNKKAKADSIFNAIQNDYNEVKRIASQAVNVPTALSGAMHKDIWYLPNGNSTEAKFFKDANIKYLWEDEMGEGSLALSFETVLSTAHDADLWFSPSNYKSLEDMLVANNHYSQFKAFKQNKVFSFATTVGEKGGVLYYESGFSRPDLVLKDLIKIGHPELLQDYTTHFFKALK